MMLEQIYPWSFAIALVGLLCWSLIKSPRLGVLFRTVFFLSIAIWGLALYLSPADLVVKAGIALRDLLVLGIASLAMHWARSNPISGILVLIASGIFLQLSYLDILKSSPLQPGIDYASEELLVDLADVDVGLLQSIVANFGGSVRHVFDPADGSITDLDEYYLVDLPGQASQRQIDRLISELTRLQIIDWAEPNEVISLSPVETELEPTLNPASSALVNDPDVGKQWAFEALEIPDLYQVLSLKTVTPRKVALIAVLDTGVDANHEDLKSSYQSTNLKYDLDVQGHGTHVAGIAAAVSNNNLGIASFDPSHEFVRVTSIKVLSDQGFGSQAIIVKGMIEAADAGADVISMSLGGRSNNERELTYEKAVKYCNDKGAVVIVAAGNSNANAKFYTPANVKNVIAVSAVNRALEMTPFSNSVADIEYGLAAPGDEIYSTFPKNQYKAFRGTSMACPHVSSLAGILKSLDPDLTTADIYHIIENTGKNSRQGKQTGKIIDPGAAVRAVLD